VFECIVDPAQWVKLRQALISEIDPEADSLRFYFLGANWRNRVEHIGAKVTVDQEGPLII
jgi:CRISPR-associated protein Cas2